MSTATYRARRTRRRATEHCGADGWPLVMLLGAGAIAVAIAGIAGYGPLADEVLEIRLPLQHEDIIRQQAADKDVDAALIAAVIFEESKFRDQTSHAGARGLMQTTPGTATSRRSPGGIAFEQGDLAGPQINIAYGAWYLDYLTEKYDGHELAAIAAYNARRGHRRPVGRHRGRGWRSSTEERHRLPETREYVDGVMDRRAAYRKHYSDQLGY